MRILKCVENGVIKSEITSGPGGTIKWTENISGGSEYTELDGENDLILTKNEFCIEIFGADFLVIRNFTFFGLYKSFFGRLKSLWEIYKWMKE